MGGWRSIGFGRGVRLAVAALAGLAGISGWLAGTAQETPAPRVVVSALDGPVGPPAARLISELIGTAEEEGAELAVL
ncbi:MAG: hypothetical protein ACQEUZ_18895, partial [Pseudomonadota bacterium]